MDGTVYKGMKVIPGATEFIEDLKKRKIPFRFVTNNSSKGRRHYYEKLKKLGFDVDIDDVLTSGIATLEYLINMDLQVALDLALTAEAPVVLDLLTGEVRLL